SGMHIHKRPGKANQSRNRPLHQGREDRGLLCVELQGGSRPNAIPPERVATIIIAKSYEEALDYDIEMLVTETRDESATVEPNLEILIEASSELPTKVMPPMAQFYVVRGLYTAHNGVYKMSPDFDDLVETSNNIAKVAIGNGKVMIQCLTRSSVETSKYDLANALRSAFELMGCEVDF